MSEAFLYTADSAFLYAAGSAFVGSVLGAWLTFYFGLKKDLEKDQEERRREKVTIYLIDAYFALESYAKRGKQTKERVAAIENAMASIFLFGDAKAIELVRKVNNKVKCTDDFDVKDLGLHLRDVLRKELAIEAVQNKEIIHFRGPPIQ